MRPAPDLPAPRVEDGGRPFAWLISASYDDRGNAVTYEYAAESGQGVDGGLPHEADRPDSARRAQRYLKRVRYGNAASTLAGGRPGPLGPDLARVAWHFEAVFDYGDHDADAPVRQEGPDRAVRLDPFSNCRAGFEVRTYRLCRRVLMFHNFPDERGVGDGCLVRSLDLAYRGDPARGEAAATLLASATLAGYERRPAPQAGYFRDALPALEFEYSVAEIDPTVFDLDAESRENLPQGLLGGQWVDLDGEGLSGLLREAGDGWYYKRNAGADCRLPAAGPRRAAARLGPLELVARKPVGSLAGGGRLLDLDGDGRLDFARFDAPAAGSHARAADAQGWDGFRPFRAQANLDAADPNLRFVDLDGDGLADALVGGDDAWTWHASLGPGGFGPERRVPAPHDEGRGPKLCFADGAQTVFLADLSGDGLADVVRVTAAEVCYWPALGYGRFGHRVVMGDSPRLDRPDRFDARRVRLADLDGTGTADLIYLGAGGVTVYLNRSGNTWGPGRVLDGVPPCDGLADAQVADLLGNGTACLVWSSPAAADAPRSLRYVDLLRSKKPHLLTAVRNNLGAETRVRYAPSTQFYLADRAAGRPWATRLPFPVWCVERVETIDRVSRQRFSTRHAYRHGHFDGVEREFRGFGFVEQWDTDERDFAGTAGPGDDDLTPVNVDAASHVPPVHTKTWLHTGAAPGLGAGPDPYAAEYWAESDAQPPLAAAEFAAMTLAQSELPPDLSAEEWREAHRALKGSVLRREVYADDDTPDAAWPYSVSQRNYRVVAVQPRGANRHAVFFTHALETADFHYERKRYELPGAPGGARAWYDPRVSHTAALEVDEFGNVKRSVAVAYGRRAGLSDLTALLALERLADAGVTPDDHRRQRGTHVTLALADFTNACVADPDAHRTPLPSESRTFELVRTAPADDESRRATALLRPDELRRMAAGAFATEPLDFEDFRHAEATLPQATYRLPLSHTRTRYRADDLTRLLDAGVLEPRAVPGESRQLAFPAGSLPTLFARGGVALLPADPRPLLEGEGGYALDPDGSAWVASGRTYYHPAVTAAAEPSAAEAAAEFATAAAHFFQPRRARDAFGGNSFVDYDRYDLLVLESRDALGNAASAGERAADGTVASEIDYRVLQPRLVTDANGNRAAVAFDALGLVVASAVMGKRGSPDGDRLDLPLPPLPPAFFDDPRANATAALGTATTRVVYDLHAFARSRAASPGDPAKWLPAVAAAVAREVHVGDLPPGGVSPVRVSFGYSDGFGREIQRKVPAEAGPLEPADPASPAAAVRWAGTGWTHFNNKGQPVRRFEPFFSPTHRFEPGREVGVASTLFYDSAGRVAATLHPDRTWEKVAFDPWRQESWGASDTVATPPDEDAQVGAHFRRLALAPAGRSAFRPTWFETRTDPALALAAWPGADAVSVRRRADEAAAAAGSLAHAGTPSRAVLDSLGRTHLTLAHNRRERDGVPEQEFLPSRVAFDGQGRPREVSDALGRAVAATRYDLLGRQVRQASFEAGERWRLPDAAGQPLRAWDSRAHDTRYDYDPLRRPTRTFVRGADPRAPAKELLTERRVYGEQLPGATAKNLRGRLARHLDAAGQLSAEAGYDFKGSPLGGSRRLARDYRNPADWSAADAAIPAAAGAALDPAALDAALAPLLEGESFTGRTEFDALGRPRVIRPPRSDRPGTKSHSVLPGYNLAGLLERLDVRVGDDAAATAFVTNIDYDAKGQRTRVDYGPLAADRPAMTTDYTHDPQTFRLLRLRTTRATAPAGGSPLLQDLRYCYDAAGNVTAVHDDAQPEFTFDGEVVSPSGRYAYDALARLVEATGREHPGQAGAPRPPTWDDAPRVGVPAPHPNQPDALRHYRERYDYDRAGNLLALTHQAKNGTWTRTHEQAESSLLAPGVAFNNRLTRAVADGVTEDFAYDAHGNCTAMAHLPLMAWDHLDRLHATARQVRNDGGRPATTFYTYDAAGERVRKVTDAAAGPGVEPTRKGERIYLGGFELYREYAADGTPTLERETLHVMDDKQRVALVELKTVAPASDDTPARLVRYQLGNHLGSVALEVDDRGRVISYEEYHPYGSTAYQAVDAAVRAAGKRYRFTGQERDDETGLGYHSARYYAPWLARWTSCDPAGLADGLNVYAYCGENPTGSIDSNGTQEEKKYPPNADPLDAGSFDPPQPTYVNTAGEPIYVMTDEQRVREKAELPEGGTVPQVVASKGVVATTGGTEVKKYIRQEVVTGQKAALRNNPLIVLPLFLIALVVAPFNRDTAQSMVDSIDGPEAKSEVAAGSEMYTQLTLAVGEILLTEGLGVVSTKLNLKLPAFGKGLMSGAAKSPKISRVTSEEVAEALAEAAKEARTTKLYHFGELEGGITPGKNFSTTPDVDYAKEFARIHGGKIHQFDVPTSRLQELDRLGATRPLQDSIKGTSISGPELRFKGLHMDDKLANEMMKYRVPYTQ